MTLLPLLENLYSQKFNHQVALSIICHEQNKDSRLNFKILKPQLDQYFLGKER